MVRADAVLLAGGRGSRLGGAVKPLLAVDGSTMLAAAVGAVRRVGAERVVVVAPMLDPTLDVAWVREDPPFGGPVAAVVAGLPLIRSPEVWLLACDLPAVSAAVELLGPHAVTADGVCLESDGRRHWLIGRYRTSALREAASSLPHRGRDAAMRTLLGRLDVAAVPAATALTRDVDTWDDLNDARGGTMTESRTLPPEALDEWSAAVAERFGLAASDIPIALILDLARDVANGVARPAAPLSAFVAGLVAGRAGGSPADTEASVAAIVELAKSWPQR